MLLIWNIRNYIFCVIGFPYQYSAIQYSVGIVYSELGFLPIDY